MREVLQDGRKEIASPALEFALFVSVELDVMRRKLFLLGQINDAN
jgi:hypothetical protein